MPCPITALRFRGFAQRIGVHASRLANARPLCPRLAEQRGAGAGGLVPALPSVPIASARSVTQQRAERATSKSIDAVIACAVLPFAFALRSCGGLLFTALLSPGAPAGEYPARASYRLFHLVYELF